MDGGADRDVYACIQVPTYIGRDRRGRRQFPTLQGTAHTLAPPIPSTGQLARTLAISISLEVKTFARGIQVGLEPSDAPMPRPVCLF